VKHAKTNTAAVQQVHALDAAELEAISGGRGGCCGGGERGFGRGGGDCAPGEACADGSDGTGGPRGPR
jgi:hypothetical protein